MQSCGALCRCWLHRTEPRSCSQMQAKSCLILVLCKVFFYKKIQRQSRKFWVSVTHIVSYLIELRLRTHLKLLTSFNILPMCATIDLVLCFVLSKDPICIVVKYLISFCQNKMILMCIIYKVSFCMVLHSCFSLSLFG